MRNPKQIRILKYLNFKPYSFEFYFSNLNIVSPPAGRVGFFGFRFSDLKLLGSIVLFLLSINLNAQVVPPAKTDDDVIEDNSQSIEKSNEIMEIVGDGNRNQSALSDQTQSNCFISNISPKQFNQNTIQNTTQNTTHYKDLELNYNNLFKSIGFHSNNLDTGSYF